MKRIVLFLIAIMTMVTANSQTPTERQKGLAAAKSLRKVFHWTELFGRRWRWCDERYVRTSLS